MIRVALLLLWVLLLGCPGSGGAGTGGGGGPRVVDNGNIDGGVDVDVDADAAVDVDVDEPPSPAATKLRGLVDEVTKLSRSAGCGRFASKLNDWTSKHRSQVKSLIGELKRSGRRDEAAELDAYVEEQKLIVVEVAADCGARDDAWPAWEAFDAMITDARGS